MADCILVVVASAWRNVAAVVAVAAAGVAVAGIGAAAVDAVAVVADAVATAGNYRMLIAKRLPGQT